MRVESTYGMTWLLSEACLLPTLSNATCSYDWIRRNFNERPEQLDDVAYITGNPFANHTKDTLQSCDLEEQPLAYFKPLYKSHQGEVANGVETIPPEPLTEHAIDAWRRRDELGVNQIVIHYMQPHQPYRSKPEWTKRDGIEIIRNQGPEALAQEAASYLRDMLYVRLRSSYTLSLGGEAAQFSVPSTSVMRQNKRRFESEKAELADLLDELEADDVFYDVGANTGLYTLFAAGACPNGRVIAFEPYPPNSSILKRDIERNDLDHVTVKELALSESNGTIEFDQPTEVDIGYGSASIDSEPSGETVSVPTASGDQLVLSGDLPCPNVVKIDVEGAEPLVIEGMQNVISSTECRVVYCEVHRGEVPHRPSITDFGMTLSDLQERFETLGFDVDVLDAEGTELFLKTYR